MRKVFKINMLIAIGVVIASCNKGSDSNNTGNGGGISIELIPKIKAQTSATDTITYTYDASGRVITQVFSFKAKAEYTYSPPRRMQGTMIVVLQLFK